jgi:NAD(P)-dependent dehydrogenase (short-subunit alcohol dehydrogenase family)
MSTQTWFITGASSGFGYAFAEHALARGYNVVAAARNVSKLQALVARNPGRILPVTLDVDRPDDVEQAIQAAVARFGTIDVLINNAGYAIVGAVEETPDAELRAIMETNFFGAVRVIRAALPVMRRQRSGAIVNISSMGGQLSFAGVSAYSASKFALEGVSEALAQELTPFGIKVLIVEPGAFRTNLQGAAMRDMPIIDDYQAHVGANRAAMHRLSGVQEGDPAKAAQAIELALAAPKTPLRLQLGDDAIDAVRSHAEALLADLAVWESVGRATKFEQAA